MQSVVPHVQLRPVDVCPANTTRFPPGESLAVPGGEAENQNGRSSMQTAATNNLLLTGLSSLLPTRNAGARIGTSGLYQLVIEVAHSESLLRLTRTKLVALAEQAHAFRRMEILEAASQALLHLPGSRDLEYVGRYYQALCVQRQGKGDLEQAARLLEDVAEHAPPSYRMRALVSLGLNAITRTDYRAALSFNREALNLNKRNNLIDYSAVVRVHNELSLINTLEGNHVEALAILSAAIPIAESIRPTHPHLYFDSLNNLAVDLNAVGRHEEATHACRIALASPFASAYPEWHETREEIEIRKRSRASRSSVVVVPQGDIQFSSHNNDGMGSTQAQGLQIPRDPPPVAWPKAPIDGAGGNLVRMPPPDLHTRPFVTPFTQSDARGRVLEFSSRSRALEEDYGEDESDFCESRKTIADKLYEMLMAAIDGAEFDPDLVETLYRDYLLRQMNNG